MTVSPIPLDLFGWASLNTYNCPYVINAINELFMADEKRDDLLKGIATDEEAEAIIFKAAETAKIKAQRNKKKLQPIVWAGEEI